MLKVMVALALMGVKFSHLPRTLSAMIEKQMLNAMRKKHDEYDIIRNLGAMEWPWEALNPALQDMIQADVADWASKLTSHQLSNLLDGMAGMRVRWDDDLNPDLQKALEVACESLETNGAVGEVKHVASLHRLKAGHGPQLQPALTTTSTSVEPIDSHLEHPLTISANDGSFNSTEANNLILKPQWITEVQELLSTRDSWVCFSDGHWASHFNFTIFTAALYNNATSCCGSLVYMQVDNWLEEPLLIIRLTQSKHKLLSSFMVELAAITVAALLNDKMNVQHFSDCESAVSWLTKNPLVRLRSKLIELTASNLLNLCGRTDIARRIHHHPGHPERRGLGDRTNWTLENWGVYLADCAANPNADELQKHLPEAQIVTTPWIIDIPLDEALSTVTSCLNWTTKSCGEDGVLLLESLSEHHAKENSELFFKMAFQKKTVASEMSADGQENVLNIANAFASRNILVDDKNSAKWVRKSLCGLHKTGFQYSTLPSPVLDLIESYLQQLSRRPVSLLPDILHSMALLGWSWSAISPSAQKAVQGALVTGMQRRKCSTKVFTLVNVLAMLEARWSDLKPDMRMALTGKLSYMFLESRKFKNSSDAAKYAAELMQALAKMEAVYSMLPATFHNGVQVVMDKLHHKFSQEDVAKFIQG